MKDNSLNAKDDYSTKTSIFYSFAGFTDVIMLQFFTFLIFTFYYSVVGLSVNLITIAFIINPKCCGEIGVLIQIRLIDWG